MEQCSQLQLLVHDALAKHLHESAVFFADKLVTLGGTAPVDVYTLAQAFFMNKQHRRALHLLRRSDLIEQDLRCCYLAALCLAETGAWEEVLTSLGGWDEDVAGSKFFAHMDTSAEVQGQELSLRAAMLLLRGKAYMALENQQRATRWLKLSLQADPFCYEAFKLLIENHMLTSKEEFDMVEGLRLQPEHEWLKLMYRAKCKKYDQQSTLESVLERLEAPPAESRASPADAPMADAGSTPPGTPGRALEAQMANAGLESASRVRTRSMAARVPQSPSSLATLKGRPDEARQSNEADTGPSRGSGCGLADNLDVLVCRADWLHHLGAYQECFQLTSSVLERDPFAMEAMPLHLTAALELRKKNELFICAHRLVEAHPESVVSWFAVACYYLCTRQFEVARRYFGKATAMSPAFALGWIGFGHSFAFQDESDQAMAAYRTAARLLPGLHIPPLGMGMEYHRMNNLALAEQLFMQAHAICPADPLACNELGVLAFRNQSYYDAESWFDKALDRLPESLTPAWEATLNNLGHVYRKQRRYDDAVGMYLKALGLSPGQASTFVALGYTYHLQGRMQTAILYYHKGLGIRPDDGFAREMLNIAVKEDAEQSATEL